MSFYPQPNKYQCGPFALKYALVMLGRFESEYKIAQKAGSTWWYGTDEIGLAKAAKFYDCKMKYFKSEEPKTAIKSLTEHIKKGYPCILSVDNWGHWFTVVNVQQKKFIITDSSLDKVISILTPHQLLKRWKYYDEDVDTISFDGYAIIPQFKVTTKARFTLDAVRYIMDLRNKELAKNWDKYFNDLISICHPRHANTTHLISFKDFLRRYEKLLVKQVAYWHGEPSLRELKKILTNFQFMAEVYDLVIHADEQKKALIDLASILMMYSCGKYGMEKIY
ncbi:MAG: cysteine peptidase family C39 domain-containing protein [Ignavibacterium sp.]|nr:cysteine peptidase family C39 domain-containing protein [Ignavibacterium sp.]MCX7612256.1 cysteine peptidase family C39 domain-containing protein [Ignavibacterium sp.]MDW8374346.1 cysteine peptidase family C39 domain-containing protein [Ignavibacteriales bacterium]